MFKKIVLLLIGWPVGTSFAQSDSLGKIQHKVVVGYNIGAVSPIGFPENIRKVYGYSPLFSPSVGYEAVYKIDNHWKAGAGLHVDAKCMRVKDSVAYLPTIIRSGNDQLEGIFSGKNETNVRNIYLTLPLYLQWTPGKRLHYQLGVYMAYLLRPEFEGTVSDGYLRNGGPLGEKLIISSAEFDFSEEESRWDMGVHAAVVWDIKKKWSVATTLQWGLIPVFPASFSGVSFKMYNIFGNIGWAYSL